MVIEKQVILDMLASLPDQFDLDELLYHLDVLARIEEGERDIAEGRVVSHEQVMQDISVWRR